MIPLLLIRQFFKDSLAKLSQNSWYGLGTISSKWVDGVPPDISASFCELVWVALISSGQAPKNWTRSQSSLSHSSESGHAKPGRISVLVCSGWILDLLYMHLSMEMDIWLPPGLIGQYVAWPISVFCGFRLAWCWHLIIAMSPMRQSILGLCSISHICPRIIVVQKCWWCGTSLTRSVLCTGLSGQWPWWYVWLCWGYNQNCILGLL